MRKKSKQKVEDIIYTFFDGKMYTFSFKKYQHYPTIGQAPIFEMELHFYGREFEFLILEEQNKLIHQILTFMYSTPQWNQLLPIYITTRCSNFSRIGEVLYA